MIIKQLYKKRLTKLESAYNSSIIAHNMTSYHRSINESANVDLTAVPIQPPTFRNFALTESVVAAKVPSPQINRDQIHSTGTGTLSSRHSTATLGHRSTTRTLTPKSPFVAARTSSTQNNRNINTNSIRNSIISSHHFIATLDHRPITNNFTFNSPFVTIKTLFT